MRLLCFTRECGSSWQLAEGDQVQVWNGNRMLAEIRADLLLDIVALHLTALQLQAQLAVEVVPARRPLAPAILGRQLERARARRARTNGTT